MSGDLEDYLEYFGELCEQLQNSQSLDYEDMGRFVYAESTINERLLGSSGAAPGAFAEFVERQRALKNSWDKKDWDLYHRLKNPESGGNVIMSSTRDPGAELLAGDRSSICSDPKSARSPEGSGRASRSASHSELRSIFGHVRTLEGIATSLSCKDLKEVGACEMELSKNSEPFQYNKLANFRNLAAECAPGSRSARQLTARILQEGVPQCNLQDYHKAQDDRRLLALGLTPRGARVPALPLQEIVPQKVSKSNAKSPSSCRAHSPACRVLNAVPMSPSIDKLHCAPAVTAAAVSAWPVSQAAEMAPSVSATVVAEPAARPTRKTPDAVSASVVTPKSLQNSARGKCAVWIKGGQDRPSPGLRRSQSAVAVARTRSSLSEPEAEAEVHEAHATPRMAVSPKRTQRGKESTRFSQMQINELFQEIRAIRKEKNEEIKALREEKNSELEQVRSECRGLRLAFEKAQKEIKELKEEASLKKNVREKDKENQEPVDNVMDTPSARMSEVKRIEMQRMRMKDGCDRAISMYR